MRALLHSTSLLHATIPLAALVLAIWAQWAQGPRALDAADEWLRDRFIGLQLSEQRETRILVVDIDEASLAEHPWPWSRDRLAELAEILIAGGARGVALDILQGKPGDPVGDARIGALAQQGPLVLAQIFDYEQRAEGLRFGKLAGGVAAPAPGDDARASGYMANHAGLAKVPHVGNIGMQPDADGVLRRVPMYTWYDGRRYPTLSRALIDCCAAQPPLPPADERGFVRVPFTRSQAAYDVASAGEVLERVVPETAMAGRLVLIGSSSLSIGDRVATPLEPSHAGLRVHAAMLTSLLDRQAGLAPAPWPGRGLAVAFAAALSLAAMLTFTRLSAALNALLLAGAALAWVLLAYLIAPHDPHFSVTGPLLSAMFLLAVGVPFHWQLSQSGSRRLLDTMRRYVAGAVVDELLRSGMKDPLAPRHLQVTTLIADMQGYTTQVESLPVEEAARLTTEFLACLTGPVLDNHGTLDKYTGDGLVAFWGAPIPNEAHADLALDAARQILREVQRYSQSRVRAGGLPLRVRIGIESGPAMVGDFGTSFRSIYTAVGDSVNTASRLEQEARNFPYDVIIGEGTVGYARRHRFISLGQHALRGKEKTIALYTLDTGKAGEQASRAATAAPASLEPRV